MSDLAVSPVEHPEGHPEAPVSASPVAPTEPLFSEREIQQFDADDGDAGRALGKMLATFFLYTVIVMLGVALWTFSRQ